MESGNARIDDLVDELASYVSQTPWDRLVQRLCPWRNCTIEIDPIDGKIYGSFGPVLCPCDNTYGWRAEYIDQMGKPGVPAKRRGRHGSRVQRAERRHFLPADDGYEYLPVAAT